MGSGGRREGGGQGDVQRQRGGYELEFEDTFEGDALDESRWIPHHLPQWSTRELAAARYEFGGGCLRLLIEANSTNPYRAPEWRRLSRQVTERDGACVRCGSTEYLNAHHITPCAETGLIVPAEQLVTLCVSCHGKPEAARRA